MKTKKVAFGVAEKLEIVQTRQQGLSLSDVGKMYGVHPTMVSKWTCAYERNGIAGLEAGPKGRTRQFSPKVKAAEQIIKDVVKAEPDAGIGKVQGALYRQGFLKMARETVRQLLRRNGVEPQEVKLKRRNKPVKVKSFERACPNDLWQTDIMTFMLMLKGSMIASVSSSRAARSRAVTGSPTLPNAASSSVPRPTGRTSRPRERRSMVTAALANSQGRRLAGANTIAPSVTRSVRRAMEASTTHGSSSSTDPIATASNVNTPSQPAASAAAARSPAARASPTLSTIP